MEKIYGSNVRQDGLVRAGNSYYLYYGFGKDNEDDDHGYNYRHKFNHKPSQAEIKEKVLEAIEMHAKDSITCPSIMAFRTTSKTVCRTAGMKRHALTLVCLKSSFS